MSHVTCQIIHVTCHMSRVACHMSHVTCKMSCVIFLSAFFGQIGEAYPWRVCSQWGLPRPVLLDDGYIEGLQYNQSPLQPK